MFISRIASIIPSVSYTHLDVYKRQEIISISRYGKVFRDKRIVRISRRSYLNPVSYTHLKGFGMELYAYDAFCPKDVIEKDGVKAVDSAEELYKT